MDVEEINSKPILSILENTLTVPIIDKSTNIYTKPILTKER